MQADLDFADGRTGAITSSMLSSRLLSIGARVTGTEGTMDAVHCLAPQLGPKLSVRSASGRRKEQVTKQSSYAAQLQAFAAAVLRGEPYPTNVDDAIANMRVIDACYAAAGLPRREPTAPRG